MRGTKIYYEGLGDRDVIDLIKDYNLNFNRGNILKYIIRAGKKEDELQDLLKAKDYIEREIEHYREVRRKACETFLEAGGWTTNTT